MEKLREETQQVFRDVFEDDQLVLTDSMTAGDVPGWDSLGHLNLVIALEKRFGLKFATAEISRLKEEGQNTGSLLILIKSKINEFKKKYEVGAAEGNSPQA
jgi:acyl carrier protein